MNCEELIKALSINEHFVVNSEGKLKSVGWDKVYKIGPYHGYISISKEKDSFFFSLEEYRPDGSIILRCKIVIPNFDLFYFILKEINKHYKLNLF